MTLRGRQMRSKTEVTTKATKDTKNAEGGSHGRNTDGGHQKLAERTKSFLRCGTEREAEYEQNPRAL